MGQKELQKSLDIPSECACVFFATFSLQSIRTEIPRLTDGSRSNSPEFRASI
ncbi:MAG: hypothetical protein GKR87_16135 [Kiritimatiellae bacterium]|nr:hypothetical protein [Kiritimatiellia bacterium]